MNWVVPWKNIEFIYFLLYLIKGNFLDGDLENLELRETWNKTYQRKGNRQSLLELLRNFLLALKRKPTITTDKQALF